MSSALDDFLQYLRLERNASDHTIDAYRRDIIEFAERVRGDAAFNDWATVDREQARSFVMALHEAGDGKRSTQRKLSALRSFFRFLAKMERISDNPFLKLPPMKTDHPLPKIMSVNQVDLLTRAVGAYWSQAQQAGIVRSEESAEFSSARDLALVEVIYSGGLRISEAVGLNHGDLDLASGVAKVRGKGKKERLAMIGRYAAAALQDYLGLCRERGWTGLPERPVFLNRFGKRLTAWLTAAVLALHCEFCKIVRPAVPGQSSA